FLGRYRLMISITLQQTRWPPFPGPPFLRQRTLAGFPNAHRRLHPYGIAQPQLGYPFPETAVITVSRIRQNGSHRHSVLNRLSDLCKCNLRLSPKLNVLGNSGFLSPMLVLGPNLRQV